jgi:hypothetical protein
MSGGADTSVLGRYRHVDQLSTWDIPGLEAKSDGLTDVGERIVSVLALRDAPWEHGTFDDDPAVLTGSENHRECSHAAEPSTIAVFGPRATMAAVLASGRRRPPYSPRHPR